MDKDISRFTKIKQNLDNLNLKFNRFSAFDGKKLSTETILNNTTPLCRTLLCNYGIVGCGLSHLTLWKQLIDDKNTDAYLILEDDAIIDSKSINILKKIDFYYLTYDINLIFLHCNNLGCDFITEFTIDNYNFGKPYFPLTTTGYIITKKGAIKLLNILPKINYHIDIDLAIKNLYNNLNFYACSPPLIFSDTGESSIANKNFSPFLLFIKTCGFNSMYWGLNAPLIAINLFFVINTWFIIILLLLLINKLTINNKILYLFIFLEILVYFFVYF